MKPKFEQYNINHVDIKHELSEFVFCFFDRI